MLRIIQLQIAIAVAIIMFFAPGVFAQNNNAPPNEANKPMRTLIDGLTHSYPAPPLQDIAAWINSKPLTIQELHGKVVLIDFWAYSCINCVRTFPYLKEWYAKYHDQGFEIIGVHSPEFDFERDEKNVAKAVTKFGIKYPVALDNNFATWRNYDNHYWPAHYLIDKNGMVVYTHFGEGKYDTTENNIIALLGLNDSASSTAELKFNLFQSPETYLGFKRINNFADPKSIHRNIKFNYNYPAVLEKDQWALQGDWIVKEEKIVNLNQASIKIRFNAKNVFAVMGAPAKPINISVTIDGENKHTITVEAHTLYTLAELTAVQDGVLEISVPESGLEVYTFTFGS